MCPRTPWCIQSVPLVVALFGTAVPRSAWWPEQSFSDRRRTRRRSWRSRLDWRCRREWWKSATLRSTSKPHITTHRITYKHILVGLYKANRLATYCEHDGWQWCQVLDVNHGGHFRHVSLTRRYIRQSVQANETCTSMHVNVLIQQTTMHRTRSEMK